MSNQIVPLGYANTFGDWVVTTNKILAETNDIGANNYTKDSGTFIINSSGTGILVKNDAIVQGAFTVAGVGSSASVQNDLTVGRQLYLSNTQTSLLANGTANILGNLLVGGMIMPTYGNGSNGISFLGGTTGDSANIKYYPTSGDSRRLHVQVTNDNNDDIYLDASGTVVIPNGRDSTSVGTGALVVTGGVGIGGDIFIGGTLRFNSDAETQLGGFLNVSNSMSVTANVTIGKNLNVGGQAFFSNTDQSTTATTGAIITAGGIGVAKNITVDGTIQANSGSSYGIAFKPNPGGGTDDTATIKYFVVSGEKTTLELAVNNDADDSINLTSSGPVNVTNKLNVGGNLNVVGDFTMSGITNYFIEYGSGVKSPSPAGIKNNCIHGFNAYGSTDFPGNYYTGWTVKGATVGAQLAVNWDVSELGYNTKMYVRANDDTNDTAEWSSWERVLTANVADVTVNVGYVNVKGTTDASSSTTGSLIVDGGAGIAKKLYVGTTITAGGDITAFSDARLKKNVKIIENALEKVQDLNGYTYERTDIDVGRQTGVIAQEVMHVLPEAVSITDDGKYTVAYGNMVGLLIESIKQLNSQVTSLKEEIEKLKNPS
jgi:hypothetical protein